MGWGGGGVGEERRHGGDGRGHVACPEVGGGAAAIGSLSKAAMQLHSGPHLLNGFLACRALAAGRGRAPMTHRRGASAAAAAANPAPITVRILTGCSCDCPPAPSLRIRNVVRHGCLPRLQDEVSAERGRVSRRPRRAAAAGFKAAGHRRLAGAPCCSCWARGRLAPTPHLGLLPLAQEGCWPARWLASCCSTSGSGLHGFKSAPIAAPDGAAPAAR